MRKIRDAVKHYIKESLDSLLIDQLASIMFGVLVTWIVKNNLHVIDNEDVPAYIKFLILAVAFLIVYIVSTALQLRPHRYKFRIRSLDIIVEYLGDVVNIYSTYTFTTNRFRTNKMYARRTWFSDEKFKFKIKTKGYKIERIGKLGNDNEYNIVFPKYQYFWQKKTFEAFLRGTNKKRKFENFYWYDVICPTDRITIDVRIPQEYCTKKVSLKSFLDHEGSEGSDEKIIEYNGAYKWEINSPKLGWSYKFEWNWSKNELALRSRLK